MTLREPLAVAVSTSAQIVYAETLEVSGSVQPFVVPLKKYLLPPLPSASVAPLDAVSERLVATSTPYTVGRIASDPCCRFATPTASCGWLSHGVVIRSIYATSYLMPLYENLPDMLAAVPPVSDVETYNPQYLGMMPPNFAAMLNGWM